MSRWGSDGACFARVRFRATIPLVVEGTMLMVRTSRRLLLRIPVVLLFAGLLSQVNCAGQSDDNGPSCSGLCKRGLKECPELPRVDCDSQCLYEDARAQKTGCADEVDAVAACSEDLDNICTVTTACKPEVDRFWVCINEYCVKHPSSEYCPKPKAG
jgi:hypothetical protein